MKRLPLFVTLFVVVVVLAGVTVWRVAQAVTRRADAAEATVVAPGTPVEVLAAPTRDLVDVVRASGNLRPRHEADVVAEVPGRVVVVHVDVGARVSAGQALASLDATDLSLQVQQAEAGLAGARAAQVAAARDLGAAETMAAAGGGSEGQVVALKSRAAVAEAQVQQAEAAVALARLHLADTTLRAPFAGVVVRRNVDLGAQVAPGLSAFTVADLSSLELVVDVDEHTASHVAVGDVVGLASDTAPQLPAGTVKTVTPALDPVTHKAQLVITVAAAPGLIAHGSATATLTLGHAAGVVALPVGAIVEDRGEHVVFVAEGGVVRRTPVTLGLREGSWVEIRGIPLGAPVVVSGNTYLSDGAAVTVRTREPS